jgi:glycosyltransferase involved in cell wall biosynthesis
VVRRHDAEGTDYYLSPRIFWHLLRIHPNVIISGGFSFPTLYALIYARLFNAKLIVYSDGTKRSERNLSHLQRVARQLILPHVDACVAKSKPAIDRFEELVCERPVFLAPHTTNLAPLLEIAARRDFSQRNELRLLSIGRLIKRKGIHHLLGALGKLPATRRPVRLTIVGSGPDEQHLKALAAALGLQRVRFAGFVDQADLPPYYADADAFVFPTLDDPFGIVLLEAAASGLALIASRNAGATEDLIRDSDIGMICDPQDEDALANQIAALADNHELVVRMGRAACDTARSRTSDRTIQGYVSAIEAATNLLHS